MPNSRPAYQLKPVSILTVLLEVGFVMLCAFFMTRHLQNWSPKIMFGGPDFPSAMHENSFIWKVFSESGRIPLWNPFIGFGQPMLENLASSALNPLVMFPVIWFGPVQGAKVALFFHLFLMGLGGWLLGRVLRLDWPGRILAGLLFAGNGSIVTQFGIGFTHLAFPQAYIAFALTGLIGTLYLRRRWPLVMIAVASALMPFSGGVWYILPTGIAASFITLFAVVYRNPENNRLDIDWRMIRRLALATAFALGLVAIRLLTFNKDLVYHPQNWGSPPSEFIDMLLTYFVPYTPQPQAGDLWINYHYVLPGVFAVLLVIARFIVYRPQDESRRGVWRVIVPALIVIIGLTFWAQGKTPFIDWLYTTIPFLGDWKNSGRIGAGVTPWIIVLTALWFDDVVFVLRHMMRGSSLKITPHEWFKPISELKSRLRLPDTLARVMLLITLASGVVAALDTLGNWPRLVNTIHVTEYHQDEEIGITFLRAKYPHSMLSTLTQGWITQFGFVNNQARTTHGDATIFTFGRPSTIGPDSTMRFNPEFSVGANKDYVNWMRYNGYLPIPDAPVKEGDATAWYNPTAPSYAFWMPRSAVAIRDWQPISRSETTAVDYYHQIDSVIVNIGDYTPNALLIIDETAYPGWWVTVDGQPAIVESVGGRLAVALPDKNADGGTTQVIFGYRPLILYFGGLITVLTALFCMGFLLRLDERVQLSRLVRLVPEPVRKQAIAVTGRAVYVLTTPGLLDNDPVAQHSPEVLRLPPPVVHVIEPGSENGKEVMAEVVEE